MIPHHCYGLELIIFQLISFPRSEILFTQSIFLERIYKCINLFLRYCMVNIYYILFTILILCSYQVYDFIFYRETCALFFSPEIKMGSFQA